MIFGFYLANIFQNFAFSCLKLFKFYTKTTNTLPYKIANSTINSKCIFNLEEKIWKQQ